MPPENVSQTIYAFDGKEIKRMDFLTPITCCPELTIISGYIQSEETGNITLVDETNNYRKFHKKPMIRKRGFIWDYKWKKLYGEHGKL